MKVGVEALHAIQYELRMMDSPTSGASYVDGDNMLVIQYTSRPESTLKKKCRVIAYHATLEYVTMEKTLTGHIRSDDDPMDLLTKVVTGHKHKHLVSLVLYDIYDRVPNNGQVTSFSVLAKSFHVIMIAGHEYAFEGTRKIWPR